MLVPVGLARGQAFARRRRARHGLHRKDRAQGHGAARGQRDRRRPDGSGAERPARDRGVSWTLSFFSPPPSRRRGAPKARGGGPHPKPPRRFAPPLLGKEGKAKPCSQSRISTNTTAAAISCATFPSMSRRER